MGVPRKGSSLYPTSATHTLRLLCVVQTPDTGTGFHLCLHGMSRVRVRLGTAALCRAACATVPDAGYWFLWHMVVDAFGPGESIMAWDSGLGGDADGRSSSPSLSPLAWRSKTPAPVRDRQSVDMRCVWGAPSDDAVSSGGGRGA